MKNSAPIRSNSQVSGDIGETAVQLILKKFGWAADIIKSDYGEDIDCNIFIESLRTNYYLRCQVKSTQKGSKYLKRTKDGCFSVTIESATIQSWLRSYFPVFLMVYEKDSDLCYWCDPIEQVLKNPSRLGQKSVTISVPTGNSFDTSSKDLIFEKVKLFYQKILRLDEALIECEVIPVLMPGYRVIPFHMLSHCMRVDDNLPCQIGGRYIELLPAWMTILNKLDPGISISTIKIKSSDCDLDNFLTILKAKLQSFEYALELHEWVSLVVSPIKIQSTNSSWSNEVTYWTTYSIINGNLIEEFDYSFDTPKGYLRQAVRRARSWDWNHVVNPSKDIAVQFFAKHTITPALEKIDETHDRNVKGQLLVWECNENEIDQIIGITRQHYLDVKIIENELQKCLLAITTPMFDPFVGIYSVPMDWETSKKGNVRHKMETANLFEILPGKEYQGELPSFLVKALNRFSNKKYENAQIIEFDYTAGFPLLLDKRLIQVSRFQMVNKEDVRNIKRRMKQNSPIVLNEWAFEFTVIDNVTWSPGIYELSLSWCPELNKSSAQSFSEAEDYILELFDKVLPSNENSSLLLKNTYDILHLAGEIGFEKTRN